MTAAPKWTRQNPELPDGSTAFGPRLPGTGLTALQRIAGRRYAAGEKPIAIRKSLGVSKDAWAAWSKSARWLEYVEQQLDTVEQVVQEALADGELKAAAKLVSLLDAKKQVRGAEGKLIEVPDNDVQARAAISLLDRRGERGKPVERVEQQSWNMTPGETGNELSRALRDPMVQQMLTDNPALQKQLITELARLAHAQEVPCEVSDAVPSSPALLSPAPSSPTGTAPMTPHPSIGTGGPPSSNAAGAEATSPASCGTSSPMPPSASATTACGSAAPSESPSGSTPPTPATGSS